MTCVGGLNFLTTWCLFPWEGAERQSPAGRLFYNLASAARSGIDTAFPALSRPASSSGRGNKSPVLDGTLERSGRTSLYKYLLCPFGKTIYPTPAVRGNAPTAQPMLSAPSRAGHNSNTFCCDFAAPFPSAQRDASFLHLINL